MLGGLIHTHFSFFLGGMATLHLKRKSKPDTAGEGLKLHLWEVH